MTSVKKLLSAVAATAVLSVGALAVTAGTASAYVVCNGSGDCWHTDQRTRYAPDVKAEYHPDNWYFHRDWSHDNDHHWREQHEGHGFYRGGVWVTN